MEDLSLTLDPKGSSFSSLNLNISASEKIIQSLRSNTSCTRSVKISLNQLNFSNLGLVGRDRQKTFLSSLVPEAYQQYPAHKTRIVSILGASGTGKSALSKSLKESVEKKSGIFCVGKIDVKTEYEPYSVFISLLEDLDNNFSNFDESYRKNVKLNIKNLERDDVKTLLEFLPNLENFFVEDQNLFMTTEFGWEMGNISTKFDRVMVTFRKFIQAICTKENPLVFVLDDMHRADNFSLLLLESLLIDMLDSSLLIICIYRVNEVQNNCPLSSMVSRLKVKGILWEEIELENLAIEDVHNIVGMVLNSYDEASTLNLAMVIHNKTNGNPSYVLSYIRNLVDEGLLRYDAVNFHFTWDLSILKNKSINSNMVELILAKIRKLDPEIQTILKVVSCLSQPFEKKILKYVIDGLRSLRSLQHIIWPCDLDASMNILVQQTGVLIIAKDKNLYSFIHDEIKEGTRKLISSQHQSSLEFNIGQRLLEGIENKILSKKHVLLAMELCLCGTPLLQESNRIRYARWYLMAADFAYKKGAWSTSLQFAEEGIKCLGTSNNHSVTPDTASLLRCVASEAAYCLGDFGRLSILTNDVVCRDEQLIEKKVRIYLVLISVYTAQKELKKAIELGCRYLAKIGMVNIPKSLGKIRILREMMKVKRLLKRHSKESILRLPLCVNEDRKSAMSVLVQMKTAAYLADKRKFILIILILMKWTLKYGINRFSPIAICEYGLILCGQFDNQRGTFFGNTALALAEGLRWHPQKVSVMTTYFGFIHACLHPIQSCIEPLKYGYQVARSTGDHLNASICLAKSIIFEFYNSSKPLADLNMDYAAFVTYTKQCGREDIASFYFPAWQTVLNLMGPCEYPTKLVGKAMDESRQDISKEKDSSFYKKSLDMWRCQINYLFGFYEEAGQIASNTMDVGKYTSQVSFMYLRHTFNVGMIAAVLLSQRTTKMSRRKYLKLAKSMLKRLQSWVAAKNVNCVFMTSLLNAEIASVTHRHNKAKKCYDNAIKFASRSGHLFDKALAHERTAIHFMRNSEPDSFWIKYHFESGFENYKKWGANTKADHLTKKYGHFFAREKSL